MFYLIIAVAGALTGFLFGQTLRGSRHGSVLDALAGTVGGFAFFFLVGNKFPEAVEGKFKPVGIAVLGAAIAVLILFQFAVRKPSKAERGRFGR